MLVVFIVSSISLLLAYLSSTGAFKKGLEYSFVIITVFFSIRYKYGSDYVGYMDVFNDISKYSSFKVLFNNYLSTDNVILSELGWGVLNYLFKPFGFPFFVACLTIFEYYIYYILVKKYVPKRCQWLAVFTFVLNPQILLLQLSMMRQALAIVLLILAVHLFIKEKRIYAVLCVICALLIHKSSIIVLPFFVVSFLYKYIGRLAFVFLIAIYFILIISKDYFSGIVALSFESEMINSYAAYESRVESTEMSIGLGFVFSLIPFFLLLRYIWLRKGDNTVNLFVFLGALSYALAPISYIDSLLYRLVNYFTVYTIVAIPFAYYAIKDLTIRYSLVVIYLPITLYSYYSFMMSPTWIKDFSTYHTILRII